MFIKGEISNPITKFNIEVLYYAKLSILWSITTTKESKENHYGSCLDSKYATIVVNTAEC